MEKPIIINAKECKECNVPKGWGHEIIFENNELYCGKLLVFKKGCNFSMHYHLEKDETWYVQEGKFIYRWIDTETGKVTEVELKEGDSVRQYPGQPHQLKALTDGIIFEVSTQHFDEDSYRIYREWNEELKMKFVPNPPKSSKITKRGLQLHTIGGELIDFEPMLSKFKVLSQQQVEEQLGWEACGFWSNLYVKDMESFGPGIEEGDIVVDLGANIGMSSTHAELQGASKIYCVEPYKGAYEALVMNSNSNWQCDNIAIMNYKGTTKVNEWPDWRVQTEVPCITFDEYVKIKNIDKIDYLKVDIEGDEFKVIPSISQSTYDKIQKIFIEYHENMTLNDAQRDRIRVEFISFLAKKGFTSHHVQLAGAQSFIYLWK